MNGENEEKLHLNEEGENYTSSEEAQSHTAPSSPAVTEEGNEEADMTDYGELLKSDMKELSGEFSPDKELDVSDLKNPIRYGALRDLGLSPREAYLASGGKRLNEDNRAHLSSSVPKKFSSKFSEMPRAELDAARELFGDLSDAQIRNLYKKITQ